MIRPLESTFEAVYYDGQVAIRRAAMAELAPAELKISLADGATLIWPYATMRIAADGSYGEPVRIEYGLTEALVIESHSFVDALHQHGVTRKALPLDVRRWPAVLLCCIAIAVIASVFYTWGVRIVSEQAVRFMPAGVERRLGQAVVATLAPIPGRCADSNHRLQPIVDRLQSATGSKQRFEVIYVNQGIVNAFAAPGGFIVVYRGLLDQANTPEEFAGVLAHEMQHVLHKHSARALAREFSGRALLSFMAVDSSGTPSAIQAGIRLANLKYQRSDEAEADLTGAALLARAHVDARGFLTFLRRMQVYSASSGSAWNYISTHPATDDRVDALVTEINKSKQSTTPLMTAEEWASAREVCSGN
ncbi:MAG TPA: M48 family metallopeptidase [Bryobacteraceae bacterium]|nr:M48 family metallopeptidase [Bryobacteraceae bacterium]